MLQFITDNRSRRSIEEQIREVLAAGCGWIQIDVDGLSDERVRSIVEQIMPECQKHEAFLTFRNHVELAKEINVGGVVVNPTDVFPSHARASLGAAAIVGVEVCNEQQILSLQGLDVDYVALRPYKATGTDHTEPLGLEGIGKLCRFMENRQLELPRVASGGVKYDDIAPLMEAGCNGVAMCEAISEARDIAGETARCLALLKIHEEREKEKILNN